MPFVDEANPTQAEIRAWAYAGEPPPMEDFEVVVADQDNLDLLLELVGDPDCPHRRLLLTSLYCLVAHSDRTDPRLQRGIAKAGESPDPWLRTWARRTREVIDDPSVFVHRDWCGGTFLEQPGD